jgi:hypothetical protein
LLQFHDPGALTSWAPWWRPACQMPNVAPCGSAQTAIRPAAKTSSGSVSTLPPAAHTVAAVASALSTAMYVNHAGACGAPSCEAIAATSRPASLAAKKWPGASGGMRSSKSQPNTPP